MANDENKKSIIRQITGVILVVLSTTWLFSQFSEEGMRFLELTEQIEQKTVQLSYDETGLSDEKIQLDEFSEEVNTLNSNLSRVMQQSFQWTDTVQQLMEGAMDNVARIQSLYEEKILPGEDLIDSLSGRFDQKSDSLLEKIESFNKYEIRVRQEKARIASLREKRIFTLSLAVVYLVLFLSLFFYGLYLMIK